MKYSLRFTPEYRTYLRTEGHNQMIATQSLLNDANHLSASKAYAQAREALEILGLEGDGIDLRGWELEEVYELVGDSIPNAVISPSGRK